MYFIIEIYEVMYLTHSCLSSNRLHKLYTKYHLQHLYWCGKSKPIKVYNYIHYYQMTALVYTSC